jgi:hypothetical protein
MSQRASSAGPSKVSSPRPPCSSVGTVTSRKRKLSLPARPSTRMERMPSTLLPKVCADAPIERSTMTPPSLAKPVWRTSSASSPSPRLTCNSASAPTEAMNGSADNNIRGSIVSRSNRRRALRAVAASLRCNAPRIQCTRRRSGGGRRRVAIVVSGARAGVCRGMGILFMARARRNGAKVGPTARQRIQSRGRWTPQSHERAGAQAVIGTADALHAARRLRIVAPGVLGRTLATPDRAMCRSGDRHGALSLQGTDRVGPLLRSPWIRQRRSRHADR